MGTPEEIKEILKNHKDEIKKEFKAEMTGVSDSLSIKPNSFSQNTFLSYLMNGMNF